MRLDVSPSLAYTRNMAYPSLELAPIAPIYETKGLGRAMRKISPQQRAFVLAYVETGGRNGSAAARAAGYAPNHPGSQRVTAYRLLHDEKILAAIKEVADKTVRASIVIGTDALIEIASDPSHKDRLKAATELVNRGGLLVATQHNVNVNVTDNRTPEEMLVRIQTLAKALNLNPDALLGAASGRARLPAPEDVVDAEFEEVSVDTDFDPSEDDGTDGLEDLL